MRSSHASRFASLLGLLSVALAAACTTNPTAQEVVDQSTPPICEKAKQCLTSFAVAYPGGVDECVTKTKDAAAKKYGSDLEKHSVCTDEELTKCIQDLNAAACPPGETLPEIPCKC
ncbi:hypothetical protein BH11MYX4_BH11MYX4_47670 [soil metagenome]